MTRSPDHHPWSSEIWHEATARGLTGQARYRWVQWAITHSLYGPRETEKETAELRAAVGRELGGWVNVTEIAQVDDSMAESDDSYRVTDNSATMTLMEIGEEIGVGREQVRRIIDVALDKLRRFVLRDVEGVPDGFGERDSLMPAPALAGVLASHCQRCGNTLVVARMVSRLPVEGGSRIYFCDSVCAWT